MHFERWSHTNQWLNEFKLALVHDTRGWIHQLKIETEGGAVTIRGRVNSFYAVQLAIQAIRAHCQAQAPFADARLSLVVAGVPMELQIVHPPAAQSAQRPSPRAAVRRGELTGNTCLL